MLEFTEKQLRDIHELCDIKEEIKDLEAKEKVLVDKVKKHMNNAQLTEYITASDKKISITTSERHTVTKATKDEFISELIAKGLNSMLSREISPNISSIFAEVAAGNIDESFVKKYIKTSNVTTLRVTDV